MLDPGDHDFNPQRHHDKPHDPGYHVDAGFPHQTKQQGGRPENQPREQGKHNDNQTQTKELSWAIKLTRVDNG